MATDSKNKYIEGVGRRKTSTCRVRITPAKSTSITVNGKKLEEYFKSQAHINAVMSVLKTADAGIGDYEISVHISGSGLSAQADAIRLGIARALVAENLDRRTALKKEGYLKRDPRSVERKKFGLRKARRRPQWSKR